MLAKRPNPSVIQNMVDCSPSLTLVDAHVRRRPRLSVYGALHLRVGSILYMNYICGSLS